MVAGTRASAPIRNRQAVAALKAKFGQQNWICAGILFAMLALVPLLPVAEGWMATQAALVIIYILAAQGVSVLTGYAGLVTVGHGGFLAIGAYTSALMSHYLGADLISGMIGGGLMAALIGCLLGLIFLRLAGAFMAIGTLGFAFFIGTIVNNVPIFNGRTGFSLPPNNLFGIIEIGDFGFYYVCLVTLALVTLFMYSLLRCGVGRAFKALRDAEKAAQSSGVNRLFYRTLAFTISAFITGVAGALNGHIVSFVSAEVYADIWYSVDILVAAIVGGSAMLFGPFIGGVFIVMVPFFFEQLADFSYILKGIVLIAVLMLAPAGVAGVVASPFRAMRRRALAEAAAVTPREHGRADGSSGGTE
jgi:branched-chain amino acid transport system permease protein